MMQVVRTDERAATTTNYSDGDAPAVIDELLAQGYAHVLVETINESLQVRVTKKGMAQVHRTSAARTRDLAHDRSKPRLLEASEPVLQALGISDADGRIKASRQDKYRQVEEFLRLLGPVVFDAMEAGHIRTPSPEHPLRIVDLGCGHAYLTFAAHRHLQARGLDIEVVGVDVREDSRARNARIAADLGIEKSMRFVSSAIAQASVFDDGVDVVVALHACDTATDDALAWAVRRGAGVILVAPCCHHDLQRQIASATHGVPEPMHLVTRHGLLRERFADLLTDTLRAHLLRLIGHRVDVVEFVAGEHTPRNLMIRAVRTGAPADTSEWQRWDDMSAAWGVVPALQDRLAHELSKHDPRT
jgi:SAM-dependent methyltransferase